MTQKLPSSEESLTPEVVEEVTEETEETETEETTEQLKQRLQETEEKLQKSESDKENYKKGMMKYKKDIPEVKSDSEYVTKKEYSQTNEKKAISKLTGEHPDLDKNWEDVIKFYVPRHGKNSQDDIEEDINDAYTLWKSRQTTDTKKKAVSDLTSNASKTSSTKSEATPVKSKDFKVLQSKSNVDDWYK